ncbi:MAG TPA: hypothetical protein VJM11_08225 [Nevskiaceae bacterium]|nr:hypothetical protein [Nevskiaceae bacterium]
MSRVDVLAERIKLGRLFGVAPESLGYLADLDADQLRDLRQHLTDSLFDRTKASFQRVAAASRLLPNGLVALIGEKVFGAMLCARISGLLPPDRAYDIALKLPDAFLADVSVELDPRSAREVIARMPAKRVVAVAAILVARQDYVTMGRFVDYLSRDVIREVIESIRDDAALLRTAFFIENKATLNMLVGLLPIERVRRIVVLAGDDEADLWTEALGLMSHVDDDWKRKIGDIAAEQDDAVLAGLALTAQRLQLWDSVLPLVGCMSLASQQKLARLPVLATQEVLAAIVATADSQDLWGPLLPLVGHMAPDARRAAAHIVEHLSDTTLLRLIETARAQRLWKDLVGILGDMDEAEQRNAVRLVGAQSDALLQELLEAVDGAGLWAEVLPLVTLMGPDARRTAARVVPGFPQGVLQRLVDAANARELWPDLVGLLVELPVAERREVARILAAQPDALLRRLADAIQARGLTAQLEPLVDELSDSERARLAAVMPLPGG